MSNFNASVLTRKGIALLTKAAAGQTSILFTRAATGNGEYSSGDVLENLMELKAPVQSFGISYKEIVNENTVILRVNIDNRELTDGYYFKEFGIYAMDPDEGEILYSISTAVENQWDYIPAYNNLSPSTITVNSYATVSNAAFVSIQGGTGAYATADDLNKLRADVEALVDLGNVEVAFKEVYQNVIPVDPTAMTPEEVREAISTEWNGEASEDPTAMKPPEIEEAISTEWKGESSEDPAAMTPSEIEEVTKI